MGNLHIKDQLDYPIPFNKPQVDHVDGQHFLDSKDSTIISCSVGGAEYMHTALYMYLQFTQVICMYCTATIPKFHHIFIEWPLQRHTSQSKIHIHVHVYGQKPWQQVSMFSETN